jgi:hypothetical protein
MFYDWHIRMDIRKNSPSTVILVEDPRTTTKHLNSALIILSGVLGTLNPPNQCQQTLLSQSVHLLQAFRLACRIMNHPLSGFLFVAVVKWFKAGTIEGFVNMVRQAKMMSLWSAISSIFMAFLSNRQ